MTRRSAADPELFSVALPKTGKPYTGSPDIVDGLVARIAMAAHKFAVDSRQGVDPGKTLPTLQVEIDAVRGVFLGENRDYEVMGWQRDGGLSSFLDRKYGMEGADDPIGGYFAHLALSIVKLYRSWERCEIDDQQAERGVAKFKAEASRDLLGLPNGSAA